MSGPGCLAIVGGFNHATGGRRVAGRESVGRLQALASARYRAVLAAEESVKQLSEVLAEG